VNKPARQGDKRMIIPTEIITELERELDGLNFGSVSLVIQVHDGKPRYVIGREQSIVPGKPSSGAGAERRQ
jgi:hypothetical protein